MRKPVKKKRKFYKPISLESFTPKHYELKGTKTELVLILLVDSIVAVYLGYKYYHPPDPIDVPQEGLTPKPPGEPAGSEHWKPGDVWHAEPHESTAQNATNVADVQQAPDAMIDPAIAK